METPSIAVPTRWCGLRGHLDDVGTPSELVVVYGGDDRRNSDGSRLVSRREVHDRTPDAAAVTAAARREDVPDTSNDERS